MDPSLSGGQLPQHSTGAVLLSWAVWEIGSSPCLVLTSEEGSSGHNIMLHRDSAVLRG